MRKDVFKIGILTILVGITTVLHYSTQHSQMYLHLIYREFYFLPIILAGFWYGLRGGLITSLSITALYLPFTMLSWNSFSPDDLAKVIEIVLFNVIAILLGMLRDREKIRTREKLEGVMAMAGAVAHELNTPLQVALGNSQLLQENFAPETETHEDLQRVIDNIRTMDKIIKKISLIDRLELQNYSGETKIVDIERASPREVFPAANL